MHHSANPSEGHDVRPKWYSLFRIGRHGHQQEDSSSRVDGRHQEDSSHHAGHGHGGLIKPSVDLDTTDNGKTAVATFELPGVPKSDVDIEVHDSVLTISGEKKAPISRVKNVHSIHERHYGKFTRSLHLPKGMKLEEIQANMDNGVLILTFPNHEHGLDVGQVSIS